MRASSFTAQDRGEAGRQRAVAPWRAHVVARLALQVGDRRRRPGRWRPPRTRARRADDRQAAAGLGVPLGARARGNGGRVAERGEVGGVAVGEPGAARRRVRVGRRRELVRRNQRGQPAGVGAQALQGGLEVLHAADVVERERLEQLALRRPLAAVAAVEVADQVLRALRDARGRRRASPRRAGSAGLARARPAAAGRRSASPARPLRARARARRPRLGLQRSGHRGRP